MKTNLAVTALVVAVAHTYTHTDAPLAWQSNQKSETMSDMVAYRAASKSIKNNYFLMRLVQQVMQLDSNQNSPLLSLNNAFAAGSDIDEDMVNAALAYIQSWLADQSNNVSAQQAALINRMLNLVSTMLNNDAANAAKRTELINNDWDDEDDLSDVALAKTDDDRSNTFKVYKKAKFYKDVTFKDKASFDHFVGFHGNVHFHKNVEIGGSLSVADEIVNCDLTVGCNISMSDSVSPEIGNVIKNGNPFITTYPGSASQNTFVGENAGNFTMTGIANMQNAAFGNQAMQNANPVNGADVAIGFQVLQNDTSFGGNAALGYQAMQNASPDFGLDTAIGAFSLQNDLGGFNTAVGSQVMPFNTTGYFNTGIGVSALLSNVAGKNNTAIGASSLSSNVTGNDNIAIGFNAMSFANNPVFSIGVGASALLFEQGQLNIGLGHSALQNNIGNSNIGIGNSALMFNAGFLNIAIGVSAMEQNVGGYNIAIGASALSSSQGDNNVAIGYQALGDAQGSSNIALGYNAGIALNSTESNDIYIGSVGVAGESNTIRIGDQDINSAAYMGGIFGASVGTNELPVCVDSTGKLGTCPSSKRFKQNIADMAKDSENIYDLRPVSFSYISDETDTKQYGLIAEEVAEIFPSLVVYDRDEQPLSVRYQVLPILLLNEVQKQHEVIEKQGAAIDNIQSRLLALERN